MIGLQLYAYDVLDEGVERVLEGMHLAGAQVALPLVSYCDEDIELEPGRGGTLPHNPIRSFHARDAHFGRGSGHYPDELSPAGGSESGVDGAVALDALARGATEQPIDVIPWLTLLTQRVAYEADSSCVVNVRGEPVVGWLCPNRPEVHRYVSALIEDVLRVGGSRAVFIDRIRFPEWGARGLVDACTCFCDRCLASAREQRVDIEAARSQLLTLVERFEADPALAADRIISACQSGLRALQATGGSAAILALLRFRQRAVEGLVAAARSAADRHSAQLWLDVWPPSYAWLLGQDFAALAECGAWIRPFLYYRWGGGADVAKFISDLAPDRDGRERLHHAYRSFFGFPGPPGFDEFVDRGLDPEFVTTELDFARQMLGNRIRLGAGLQLWSVGANGIRAGLDAAASHSDGVILHAYGWASLDELATAGDWIRTHRPADWARANASGEVPLAGRNQIGDRRRGV